METTTTSIAVNELFNDLLDDLQPGILKHHGRTHAFHLFLRFGEANIAKHWIQDYLAPRIKSAKKQLLGVQARHLDESFDGGAVIVFALSVFGYKKLGIPENLLPSDVAFKLGMKKRWAEIMDDKSQTGWERELAADNDAIIIVADSDEETAKSIVAYIEYELEELKAGEIFYKQKGTVLRNEHGVGIEHFGYADGVSQPLFLNEEIEAQRNNGVWQDKANLDILLVRDKGGKYEESYGSYLVFRKLEQNVSGFKETEEKLSQQFNSGQGVLDKYGNPNSELAGSMLVGRFEDGTAVIMDSNEIGIIHEKQLNNDFNYHTDISKPGAKCPYLAHVRLTNTRTPDGPIRITRRGIPYNDIGRNVNDLDNDKPPFGVGLLFMCYQANIENQFEAIQKKANEGFDAVIGQKPVTAITLPLQWGLAGQHTVQINNIKKGLTFNFVTNKGGEYFFTPSISFLKNIAAPVI